MHYVTIPAPVQLLNPIDADEAPVLDEQTRKAITYTFARSVRTALSSMLIKQTADTLAVFDLRAIFDRAEVGSTIEVTDEHWKLLEAEFKKPDPRFMTPAWVFSCESHIRAITDAPSKAPATWKATANGEAKALPAHEA